jgi:transposase-like protein
MSVLDQLRDLERQVVGRLRELEPLVHEYKQLRTAAGRLGVKYDPRPGASDSDQNVSSRRRRGARATPRSNASKRVPASASADRTGRSPKRAVPSAKSTGATRRAVRRRAAAPGQRQGQMLELVTAHPGITVAGIAQRLGIDATGLYRVMRRLTETGQIRKDGPRLYPSKQGQTPESAQATTPHTSGSGSHADSEAAAGGAKSSSTRRVAASARPR